MRYYQMEAQYVYYLDLLSYLLTMVYNIEAVIKIVRMKSYPATLRFLPATSEVLAGSVLSNPDTLPPSESPLLRGGGSSHSSSSSSSAAWMELRDSFVLFAACKSRYAAADMLRKLNI